MVHALETTRQEDERAPKRAPFASFMAVIAAANTAFILGLVATLSWQECLTIVLAVSALVGGAAFTVLEMRRLGRTGQSLG
jgi:type IV secretory pathway VirB2 component (pilin)